MHCCTHADALHFFLSLLSATVYLTHLSFATCQHTALFLSPPSRDFNQRYHNDHIRKQTSKQENRGDVAEEENRSSKNATDLILALSVYVCVCGLVCGTSVTATKPTSRPKPAKKKQK